MSIWLIIVVLIVVWLVFSYGKAIGFIQGEASVTADLAKIVRVIVKTALSELKLEYKVKEWMGEEKQGG